jgi:hypothetical protein
MRNVSDKKNQNTHLMLSNFFPENRTVHEILWKNTGRLVMFSVITNGARGGAMVKAQSLRQKKAGL